MSADSFKLNVLVNFMLNPLVTIITPSYKSKRFIKQTIDSVQEQTYTNWQMVIVDDFSNDGSVEFIRELIKNDKRFKLVVLTTNVGAAMARNEALQMVNGRFIAFLDSDDMWEPNKLEVQVDFMLEKNCAFSYTSYKVCSESGLSVEGIVPVPLSLTYNQYLANTIIGCLTVMLDAEKLGKIVMPNLRSSHDMALWADILKTIDCAEGIDIPLATYRLVGSSNTANKWRASKDVWNIYRYHLKMNVSESFFYFVQYAINAVKKRWYE